MCRLVLFAILGKGVTKKKKELFFFVLSDLTGMPLFQL